MVFKKGDIAWNKSKRLLEEHKRKISISHKGKEHSEETKRKISEASKKRFKDKKNYPFYGKHHTKETIKKQSILKIGEKNSMFGKPRPKKIREKISNTKKGKARSDICGEKNPAWRGGYEPYYGANWTQQRRLTRKRDNYTCQKCGIQENGREHDVHHIIPFREFGLKRYKEANSLDNLTTLCMSCHRKLNGGDKI